MYSVSVIGALPSPLAFCKIFLHVLYVFFFPPRGVDEDVMDKDQILLQKEAEVRAHMQTTINTKIMLFRCEMMKNRSTAPGT